MLKTTLSWNFGWEILYSLLFFRLLEVEVKRVSQTSEQLVLS